MDPEKIKGMDSTAEDLLGPDPAKLNQGKIVIKSFDIALTAMRIYPSNNPAVKKSVHFFSERLKEFLETYEELRLGIKEFSFTLQKETVFQDTVKKKSLAFLLFKDGMRTLTFLTGLEKQELVKFLEILKAATDLPPEESDVVSFLWEQDFLNIRYFVVDEFLDLYIGREERDREIDLDISKLSEGRIGLTPEDKEDILSESDVLSFTLDAEEGEEDEDDISSMLKSSVRIPFIEKVNIPEIESMVEKSRQITSFDELITLLFEALYHEERDEEFSALLDTLDQSYLEALRRADFSHAKLILDRIQELSKEIPSDSEEKSRLLARFLDNSRDRNSIEYLEDLYFKGKIRDVDSFFQFLKDLGPATISLVGMIWEKSADPLTRQKALDFLKEAGKKNVAALLYLAKGSDVTLLKEVMSLLEDLGDVEDIHYLEEFLGHPIKEIRLQIIMVLEKAKNETANRILTKFLEDRDEEVRAEAALNLKYFGDRATLSKVMGLVKDKGFKEGNRIEKTALLKYLVTSGEEEDKVSRLLNSILKRWSFFPASKRTETRLCAVSALADIATPEAVETLKKGTKVLNRTVRRACQLQLREISLRSESNKEEIVRQGTS